MYVIQEGTVSVSRNGAVKQFQFDHVFGPDITQKGLYDKAAAPAVGEAAEREAQ